MKIKNIAILSSSLLLASCSLGANVVSKAEFKKILEEEVQPTVVNSVKDRPDAYSLVMGDRNIANKTLIEHEYIANGNMLDSFSVKSELNTNFGVLFSHIERGFITKEIVTSAGVRAYSDVEKVVNSTTYEFNNVVDSDTNENYVTSLKVIEHTMIKTDYLSVELNADTGEIEDASITIDDDIFMWGIKKAVYDTFEEADTGEEEEEDPGDTGDIEVENATLAGKDWLLSDSNNLYQKVEIIINENVDTTVSKDVVVGKIKCGEEEKDLFMFERDGVSYNFEIRETTETKQEEVINKTVYDPNQQDVIQSVILPELNAYLATSAVSEIETNVLSIYKDIYDQMVADVNNDNLKPEILKRPAGLVFRTNDSGVLREVLMSKQDKDKHRNITDVVIREGFDGNDINTYTFSGF